MALEFLKAIKSGNIERIAKLLDDGVDCNIVSPLGGLPLQTAIFRKQPKAVALLLSRGAIMDHPLILSKNFGPALHLASYVGASRVMDILLDNGADINMLSAIKLTALDIACSGGKLKVVKLLLRRGADLYHASSTKITALQHACSGNHPRVVEFLLRNGADPNFQGPQMSHGLFPSTDTALCQVATDSHFEVAELLLKYGADVTRKNLFNKTSLHAAVQNRSVRTAELFLQQGADPNAKCFYQLTPLHTAVTFSNRSMFTRGNILSAQVELLLRYGADPNVVDEHGATPLHRACENSLASCVDLLLRFGADPTTADKTGATPLHLAANDLAIVEKLLFAGADINKCDGLGRRAITLCTDPAVVALLTNPRSILM